jgi:hypothetical protein
MATINLQGQIGPDGSRTIYSFKLTHGFSGSVAPSYRQWTPLPSPLSQSYTARDIAVVAAHNTINANATTTSNNPSSNNNLEPMQVSAPEDDKTEYFDGSSSSSSSSSSSTTTSAVQFSVEVNPETEFWEKLKELQRLYQKPMKELLEHLNPQGNGKVSDKDKEWYGRVQTIYAHLLSKPTENSFRVEEMKTTALLKKMEELMSLWLREFQNIKTLEKIGTKKKRKSRLSSIIDTKDATRTSQTSANSTNHGKVVIDLEEEEEEEEEEQNDRSSDSTSTSSSSPTSEPLSQFADIASRDSANTDKANIDNLPFMKQVSVIWHSKNQQSSAKIFMDVAAPRICTAGETIVISGVFPPPIYSSKPGGRFICPIKFFFSELKITVEPEPQDSFRVDSKGNVRYVTIKRPRCNNPMIEENKVYSMRLIVNSRTISGSGRKRLNQPSTFYIPIHFMTIGHTQEWDHITRQCLLRRALKTAFMLQDLPDKKLEQRLVIEMNTSSSEDTKKRKRLVELTIRKSQQSHLSMQSELTDLNDCNPGNIPVTNYNNTILHLMAINSTEEESQQTIRVDMILRAIRSIKMAHRSAILNMQNYVGQTMLHRIAINDEKELYERLVLMGADPNIKDKVGVSPGDIRSRHQVLINKSSDANTFDISQFYRESIRKAVEAKKETQTPLPHSPKLISNCIISFVDIPEEKKVRLVMTPITAQEATRSLFLNGGSPIYDQPIPYDNSVNISVPVAMDSGLRFTANLNVCNIQPK